jgi:5-methylcytosine-specific restriction endonuclease McrA
VRGQAEIVTNIVRFRERHTPDASRPRWEARRTASREYERLVRRVEWKLIHMPLPRLQMMGSSNRTFVYDIHWNDTVRRADVLAYQDGRGSSFDNRVLLKANVGSYLVQLNGLLRPLIQRRWAAMVADLNRLEDSRLETFLFGTSRAQTAAIRAGLWSAQGRRCFYCTQQLRDVERTCVDHFIPWSRYPDDGLDNLVVTDVRCNASKSNSLAAGRHLTRWVRRFMLSSTEDAQLTELAERTKWERHKGVNLGVARAIYLRLPDDARLWLRDKEFVPVDRDEIVSALA